MNTSILVTGLFILASISCTVAGNLLLKTGADQRGVGTVWPFTLLNLQTFLGALLFCCALVFYVSVLKRISLNLAQSIFAAQFVMVIIAAYFILNEPIDKYRWAGITLIAMGLFVIAAAPQGAPADGAGAGSVSVESES